MQTNNTNTDKDKLHDPVKESMLTAEVFKKDKRIKARSKSISFGKNKLGLRFIDCIDFKDMTEAEVIERLSESWNPKNGYEFIINKTYVKRKNMMSDVFYYERYDTPHYCSPSSESYWSM